MTDVSSINFSLSSYTAPSASAVDLALLSLDRNLAYWTDFSEYASDQTPDGWTKRGNLATWIIRDRVDATGGKVLSHEAGSSAYQYFTWLTPNFDVQRQHVEQAFRWRVPSGNSPFFGLAARGQDLSADEGYAAFISFNNTLEVDDLAFGSLSSDGGHAWATDAWYWLKFRVENLSGGLVNLKARVWADSASEPSTWDIETTDGTYGDGKFGLVAYGADAFEIDVLSVATYGTSATLDDPNAITSRAADAAVLNLSANTSTRKQPIEADPALLAFAATEVDHRTLRSADSAALSFSSAVHRRHQDVRADPAALNLAVSDASGPGGHHALPAALTLNVAAGLRRHTARANPGSLTLAAVNASNSGHITIQPAWAVAQQQHSLIGGGLGV